MGAGTAQGGACLLISGKVRKNMEFVVFAFAGDSTITNLSAILFTQK